MGRASTRPRRATGMALVAALVTTTVVVGAAPAAHADEPTLVHALWYEAGEDDLYVSVTVRSNDPGVGVTVDVVLDAGAGTDIGEGITFTLSRFTDAGQYIHHRTTALVAVDVPPSRARIVSSSAADDDLEVEVRRWLDDDVLPGVRPPPRAEGYRSGFLDGYLDPTEINQRVRALADEFPDLAEVVELPEPTEGYRRPAMAVLGTTNANRVAVTSVAWGHEGGNDLALALVDPGEPDAPLSVTVSGTSITVSLATDATGAITSTAAQVVAALNADAGAAELVTASTYRGNAGNGPALPGTAQLDDFLSAPEHVERAPFTMLALRIGTARDGSRPGVLVTAQQNAGAWVTPLVPLEVAERLLRNHHDDPGTRRLVDHLDLFVVPTVNPDGAHYSHHDVASQRKNLRMACAPGGNTDADARIAWGVDISRNYGEGSLFDGYAGASSTCTSTTYAGPEELSEPESRNVDWLATEFDHIGYAMNVEGVGRSLTWPPGAYQTPDRSPLPAVGPTEELFFRTAAEHLLSRLRDHRGTAYQPVRVGPLIDVVFSAAGNVVDHLHYRHDVRAMGLDVGTSLRPAFDPDGREVAMESAEGLLGFLEAVLAEEHHASPPVIDQPGDVHTSTTDPAGVAVAYDVPAATDDWDGPVPVTCTPPPGTTFPPRGNHRHLRGGRQLGQRQHRHL